MKLSVGFLMDFLGFSWNFMDSVVLRSVWMDVLTNPDLNLKKMDDYCYKRFLKLSN